MPIPNVKVIFDSTNLANSSTISLALLPIPWRNTSNETTSQCSEIYWLKAFEAYYGEIHGYLSIVLCTFGLLSNIFNIIVLNQKLLSNPTNLLLTSLAISDGTLLALYIPFAGYFLIGRHLTSSSYGWSVYLLTYISAQNLLHSASGNLVVTVACFRVIYIRYLVRCHQLCSRQRALMAVACVFLISILLTIPCYEAHHIAPTADPGWYVVTFVDDRPLLFLYLQWNTAIFLKLLPLICLTFLSLAIIVKIQEQRKRLRKVIASQNKLSYNSLRLATPSQDEEHEYVPFERKNNVNEERQKKKKESFSNRPISKLSEPSGFRNAGATIREKADARTTRLLLAVIFIFIIALVPQAVLLLLNVILGECFQQEVYARLGNLTDLLTLTSTGINFILYCSMSQQFRVTFIHLFLPFFHTDTKKNVQYHPSQASMTGGERF